MPRQTNQRSASADRGATLLELVAAIGLMTVVLTIATSAIVTMYRSTEKTQGITETAAQISMALDKLDTTIRYADTIYDPVQSGSDWYVSYRSTYNGTAMCTQLRFSAPAGQLQRRTWTAAPSPSPGAWTPLASGLALSADSGGAVQPFTVTPSTTDADAEAQHQRLRIQFWAVAGSGERATKALTDISFTQFNAIDPNTIGDCGGWVTP